MVRLDARVLQEIQTRGDSVFNEAQLREAADVLLSGRIDVQAGRIDVQTAALLSEAKRLDGRLDFITSNVDSTALDSLSEIVSQFSQNGVGYAGRLAYLEAVIADLVNK